MTVVGELSKVNGTLGDLTKKELKRVREVMPESDHWLLGNFELPFKQNGKNVVLPSRLIASVALTVLALLTMLVTGSIGMWGVLFAVFFGTYYALPAILAEMLPASTNLMLARGQIKAAIKGDEDALETPIEVIYEDSSAPVVRMPASNYTWEMQGDKDDRTAALQALTKLSGAQQALDGSREDLLPAPVSLVKNDTGTQQPAAQLPAAETAEPTPEPATWGQQFLTTRPKVDLRAAERSDEVASLMSSIAEVVDSTDPVDDNAATALATIKEDAEAAVDVYVRLDPKATGISLASGKTPTDELVALLTVLQIEAKGLFEQSQSGQADELSYLRRLNENRYQPSELDSK